MSLREGGARWVIAGAVLAAWMLGCGPAPEVLVNAARDDVALAHTLTERHPAQAALRYRAAALKLQQMQAEAGDHPITVQMREDPDFAGLPRAEFDRRAAVGRLVSRPLDLLNAAVLVSPPGAAQKKGGGLARLRKRLGAAPTGIEAARLRLIERFIDRRRFDDARVVDRRFEVGVGHRIEAAHAIDEARRDDCAAAASRARVVLSEIEPGGDREAFGAALIADLLATCGRRGDTSPVDLYAQWASGRARGKISAVDAARRARLSRVELAGRIGACLGVRVRGASPDRSWAGPRIEPESPFDPGRPLIVAEVADVLWAARIAEARRPDGPCTGSGALIRRLADGEALPAGGPDDLPDAAQRARPIAGGDAAAALRALISSGGTHIEDRALVGWVDGARVPPVRDARQLTTEFKAFGVDDAAAGEWLRKRLLAGLPPVAPAVLFGWADRVDRAVVWRALADGLIDTRDLAGARVALQRGEQRALIDGLDASPIEGDWAPAGLARARLRLGERAQAFPWIGLFASGLGRVATLPGSEVDALASKAQALAPLARTAGDPVSLARLGAAGGDDVLDAWRRAVRSPGGNLPARLALEHAVERTANLDPAERGEAVLRPLVPTPPSWLARLAVLFAGEDAGRSAEYAAAAREAASRTTPDEQVGVSLAFAELEPTRASAHVAAALTAASRLPEPADRVEALIDAEAVAAAVNAPLDATVQDAVARLLLVSPTR